MQNPDFPKELGMHFENRDAYDFLPTSILCHLLKLPPPNLDLSIFLQLFVQRSHIISDSETHCLDVCLVDEILLLVLVLVEEFRYSVAVATKNINISFFAGFACHDLCMHSKMQFILTIQGH